MDIPLPWAKPGNKVICIRSRPWRAKTRSGVWVPPPPGHTVPQFMREYTIREVGVMSRGGIGLTFTEFTNPANSLGREPRFPAKYFRPVLALPDENLLTLEEVR